VIHLDASQGGRGAAAAGKRLGALARRFLKQLDLDGCELSLVVVRDPRIRALKRTWFGVDQATDVLSFPAGDSPAPGHRVLGDIVVSMDTARRVAKQLESTTERELALYLAHGLLHLLGFDHGRRDEATAMMNAEARLLRGEGMLARARRA
jgi:probable rRNA maturation factor